MKTNCHNCKKPVAVLFDSPNVKGLCYPCFKLLISSELKRLLSFSAWLKREKEESDVL